MKKFLLSMAAVCCLGLSANAEIIVDLDQNYKGMTEFPYYQMGYAPEMKDGNMVVTNTEAKGYWEVQYFLCYNFPIQDGKDYTVTARIKSDVEGNIHVVMGDFNASAEANMALKANNEWTEYTTVVRDVNSGKNESMLVFQSGDVVGTYEIEWVKVTHEGAEVVLPTPEEGDVVASFFDGNGAEFGGWGPNTISISSAEEDGKPCLKVVNEEAIADWQAQIAINYNFTPGVTYYINFDVKGTPFNGISSNFQAEKDYASCGNLNKFNVTEEWTNVTIYGDPYNAGTEDEPNMPARWLASVGKYVGTMYITNVKVYTEKKSGVAVAPAVENGRTVVYNLQGVKLIDSEDAEEVNSLAKGIYIINGKKVAVK